MKESLLAIAIIVSISGCVSQGYTDAVNDNSKVQGQITELTTYKPSPKVTRLSSPPVSLDTIEISNHPLWLDKDVSIGISNLPLSVVLSILMDGTGAVVSYDSGVSPNSIVSLSYKGKLGDALDVLVGENDYAVKVSDERLTVIGFENETFKITLPSGVYSGQLGSQGTSKESGGDTGGNPRVEGQFMNVAYESVNTFKEIENGILSILPKDGVGDKVNEVETSSVQVIPSLSIINVRTSPNRMKQVRSFVDAYQRELNKQVVLEIQVLEFNSNLGKEQGIDWSLARDIGSGSIKFFIPSTSKISNSSGGGIAFEGTGKWDGTTALIKALEKQGSVSTTTPITGLILNNQPSKISQTSTIPFLSEIKVESTEGVISTEVKRDKLSTGVDLMVTPNVHDDFVWLRISGKLSKITNDENEKVGDTSLRFLSTQESEITFTNKLKYNQTYVIASVKQNRTEGKKEKMFGLDILGSQASVVENTETLVLLTPRRAE